MASRDKPLTKPNTRQEKYPYPSRYGSHKCMVVLDNSDAKSKYYDTEEDVVVCKDEFGEYETTVDRLDNGTADPNRFDHRRLCATPWLTL